MKEKMLILSDAFYLTLLGVRIEFYNRLLTELFRRRRLLFLCALFDRHLMQLRKEFLMMEKRHLSIICLDI